MADTRFESLCVNATGETIPAYAAVEPDGTTDADGRLNCVKPTGSRPVLFNGPTPVPPAVPFQAFSPYPRGEVGLHPADLPLAAGAKLGPVKDNWFLRASGTGFFPVEPEAGGTVTVIPGAGGGGSPVRYARVTGPVADDAGQAVPGLYGFTETESFTDTDGVIKDRDKAGGTTGVGLRKPSEAKAGVPPIRAGQTVVFTPGAVADLYDLTPWGSHHTPVVEELVRVTLEATLADDGSTVYAAINYFRRVSDGARERCISQAPAGAAVSPIGGP